HAGRRRAGPRRAGAPGSRRRRREPPGGRAGGGRTGEAAPTRRARPGSRSPGERGGAEPQQDQPGAAVDPAQDGGVQPGPQRADGSAQDEPPERGAQEHAGDQEPRLAPAAGAGDPEPREHRHERQDRRRVREREPERRRERAEPAGAGPAGRALRRPGDERPHAQVAEEEPPGQPEPALLPDEQARDRGEPEPRDGAVHRVGDGRAQPDREPGRPALDERPPDAEDADRADRRRDREPDGDAPQEHRQLDHAGGTSTGVIRTSTLSPAASRRRIVRPIQSGTASQYFRRYAARSAASRSGRPSTHSARPSNAGPSGASTRAVTRPLARIRRAFRLARGVVKYTAAPSYQ